jgi:hypothetical protein
MYNRKIVLNESERTKIKKMYGLSEQKDFVFDFVLTENNKYLIIMDQVFVSGGDGNSIGSIWEHSYIINEIITESLSKIKSLNESVKKEIDDTIATFKWEKELVREWVKDKTTIVEGFWDTVKSGLSKLGNSVASMAEFVFKQGVLPFLRWIRRMAYTDIGMVVDIIIAILTADAAAVIWLIFVALDIYEIVFDDFDPKDTERNQMPYFYVIMDIISAIFTTASASIFKKSLPLIEKGVMSPSILKMLKGIAEKIPSLSGKVKGAIEFLIKKVGSGGFIAKMLGAIDKGIGMIGNFIQKLFSKQGLQASKQGIIGVGAAKVVGKTLPLVDKNNVVGNGIVALNDKVGSILGKDNINIDDPNSAVAFARSQGLLK